MGGGDADARFSALGTSRPACADSVCRFWRQLGDLRLCYGMVGISVVSFDVLTVDQESKIGVSFPIHGKLSRFGKPTRHAERHQNTCRFHHQAGCYCEVQRVQLCSAKSWPLADSWLGKDSHIPLSLERYGKKCLSKFHYRRKKGY